MKILADRDLGLRVPSGYPLHVPGTGEAGRAVGHGAVDAAGRGAALGRRRGPRNRCVRSGPRIGHSATMMKAGRPGVKRVGGSDGSVGRDFGEARSRSVGSCRLTRGRAFGDID